MSFFFNGFEICINDNVISYSTFTYNILWFEKDPISAISIISYSENVRQKSVIHSGTVHNGKAEISLGVRYETG